MNMRKSNLLRIMALMLSLIMALGMFSGCNDNPDQTGGQGSESSSGDGDTNAAPDVKIAENGVASFVIISGNKAEEYENAAAESVKTAIKDKANATIEIKTDKGEAAELEILVGRTNRAESIEVYAELRVDDYAVVIKNGKIVIAAHTEAKLSEAVTYFAEKLQASEGSATFPGADSKMAIGTYDVEAVTVNGEFLGKYTIVYGENADEAVKAYAEGLANTIKETFGYVLGVATDKTDDADYEIVIGLTSRGSDNEINDSVGLGEYKVLVEGKDIFVVAGSEDELLEDAINAFVGKIAELAANGKAEITEENLDIYYENEAIDAIKITLNGVDITEYDIVYSEENSQAKILAVRLQDAIGKLTGRRVDIISDTEDYAGGKEILLGYSKRMGTNGPANSFNKKIKALTYNNMLMYTDGSFFFMGGSNGNDVALMAATNRLINAINDVENGEDDRAVEFNLSNPTKPELSKYKIMTYNDGDNGWRKPSLTYRVNVINSYDPDIIGMQEVERMHAMPQTFAEKSNSYEKALGNKYGIVYYDHEDPIKTVPYGNMILYKLERFELLDSGVQWLSDTPDVPNSEYEGSAYIRTYVYAVLKDKVTGEEIVFISTHVDYEKEANLPQMQALIKCAEKFRDKPLIFTGDFNMTSSWDGYKAMIAAGYVDSGLYMDPQRGPVDIDFIFFDPTYLAITDYKCIDDSVHSVTGSQAGSDHNPYVADLVIPS